MDGAIRPRRRHNVDEDRVAGGQVWFRSAEEAHRPDCRRTSPASTASRSGSPKPATRGSNAAALGRPTPTAGRRLDDQALAVLPRRAPRPGPAGRALPEHGPRGAPADGPGARAAGGPGDDQAARRGPRGSRPRRAATRSGRRGSRRTCRTGGTLEHAQQIAGHASPKTTKLYDRTADTVTVDEIERIVI